MSQAFCVIGCLLLYNWLITIPHCLYVMTSQTGQCILPDLMLTLEISQLLSELLKVQTLRDRVLDFFSSHLFLLDLHGPSQIFLAHPALQQKMDISGLNVT